VSRVPRLLPLVGVAIGGVLAVKALTEAPQLYLATRALAEDAVRPGAPPPIAPNASILSGDGASSSAAKAPPAACAPTAAELAKEAGLSPAELQVLQSLGDRRGQLDQRESSLDTQVQLIAAAEAKLDSRIQEMNGLKSDIQGLLGQADQQAQADADRLVRVYEDMPEKKAAAAMTVIDDSVRLPIAAKMKERKLAAILAQMAPADAKALTEKLAARMSGSKVLADAKTALNPPAAGAAAPAAAATAAAPAAQNAQIGQTASTTDQTGAQAPAPAKPRRVAHARPRPKARPADATAQADGAQTVKSAPAAATGQAAAPAAAPATKAAAVPAVPPTAKPG
jgi:flagellar motility protein MotE (MotC chaperone)